MADLIIDQHEAEINRIQGDIRGLKQQQQIQHDAMEKKIYATPIVATSRDQIMKPNQSTDPIEFVKGLSADALQKLKVFLKGGE